MKIPKEILVVIVGSLMLVSILSTFFLFAPHQQTPKINEPPIPVILSQPTKFLKNGFWLEWSPNLDKDFFRYELHMGTINGFFIGTTTRMDSIIEQEHAYSFVENLTSSTKYFFKVRTFDIGGLYSDSNQVDGTTPPQPKPVFLSSPSDVKATSISLIWSVSNDEDFREYDVAGSTDPNFKITSEDTFTTINDQEKTSYTITGLSSNTTYYFKIRTRDGYGSYLDSNKVDSTTPIITVKIDYDGNWTGSILDDTGSRSVDGTGAKSFTMVGGIIVANFQKHDDSSDTLTVQILEGNIPVESQSTTAEYGLAMVSHSF
jgi:hypothetical protein